MMSDDDGLLTILGSLTVWSFEPFLYLLRADFPTFLGGGVRSWLGCFVWWHFSAYCIASICVCGLFGSICISSCGLASVAICNSMTFGCEANFVFTVGAAG